MHQTVGSAQEYKAARASLLEEEKAATKLLTDLAAKRRQLPMVKVENPDKIVFAASDGTTRSLQTLFDGRQQLILYDFMLSDQDQEGCVGCSFIMDHIAPLAHLRSCDTTFAAVAGASIEKITAFKQRMGWEFPFYSTKDTFVDIDGRSEELTWRSPEGFFGIAVFFHQGSDVFHTYSTTERGVENLLSTYALLDMTPLGRQEMGNGISAFRLHDSY